MSVLSYKFRNKLLKYEIINIDKSNIILGREGLLR